VAEERERLRQVIEELNLTWSSFLSVHLELIRWETHGFPGMGADAQDVLNIEFADDYEIFVGLMWQRFGTPTGRAGSGTEEEFNRAYDRWKQDPTAVDIMFYFRRARAGETKATVQTRRIRSFKKKLGELGGLWWEFTDSDDFAALLRMHLARQVQKRLQAGSAVVTRRVAEPRAPYEVVSSDERKKQLDDMIEHYSSSVAEVTSLMDEVLSINTGFHAAVTHHLSVAENVEPATVFSGMARDSDSFAQQLAAVVPRVATSFSSVLTTLSCMAPLLLEHSEFTIDVARGSKVRLAELRAQIDATATSGAEFAETLARAAAAEPALKLSLQAAQKAVESYVQELRAVGVLASEVYMAFVRDH
jgi:hypothetical protein